jgi:hypothetical protein
MRRKIIAVAFSNKIYYTMKVHAPAYYGSAGIVEKELFYAIK